MGYDAEWARPHNQTRQSSREERCVGQKEKIEREQEVRGRMCEGVEEWRTERNKQQSTV